MPDGFLFRQLSIEYNVQLRICKADFALLDCSPSPRVARVYSRATEERTVYPYTLRANSRWALYLCMCQALPQSGNTLYAEAAEYSNCPIEQVLVWGPRAIHWEWWQDIFLDQRFAIAANVQNLVTSNWVLFCYIAFQSWPHFTSTSEALSKLHLCNCFALMQVLTATACMFGVAINFL